MNRKIIKNRKNEIKKILLALAFLTVLLFSTACIGGSNEAEQQPSNEQDVLFTLDNYPRVDGSTVTIPLSEAIMARLTGNSIDEVRPHILHNKTHQAYVNLIAGDTDVIFVTSPSEEELRLAAEAGVEFEVIPIVSEAFVFLTHRDNPVRGLSFADIRAIYAGEITNWSELGGADIEIVAYQRPINSGSQTGFLDLVMSDIEPMQAPTEQVMVGMGELIDAVASFQNEPDAIGYSYYYFVVDMWGNDQVKLLEVDGVYPEAKTISNGTYPVNTAYYAVIRTDEAADSPVRQLVDWILTESGQRLAEEAGYVRLK